MYSDEFGIARRELLNYCLRLFNRSYVRTSPIGSLEFLSARFTSITSSSFLATRSFRSWPWSSRRRSWRRALRESLASSTMFARPNRSTTTSRCSPLRFDLTNILITNSLSPKVRPPLNCSCQSWTRKPLFPKNQDPPEAELPQTNSPKSLRAWQAWHCYRYA